MRERYSKYLNNIGDLLEEINNQDLEAVNGGREHYYTLVTKDEGCMNSRAFNCIQPPVINTKGINCQEPPMVSRVLACPFEE